MSTPIRAKFIEQMEFLGLSKQTQRSYINGVKGLAKYHNESPDNLTNDQVRSYFRHLLLERKLTRSTCGSYLCGIKYFYKHLCNREVDDRFGLPARSAHFRVLSFPSIWILSPLWRCSPQTTASPPQATTRCHSVCSCLLPCSSFHRSVVAIEKVVTGAAVFLV